MQCPAKSSPELLGVAAGRAASRSMVDRILTKAI